MKLNRRKSHYDFILELKTKYPDYFSSIRILTKYEKAQEYIFLENKYGIVKAKPYQLLSGGFPTIISAIDKTTYWKNMAKEVHGDRYDYSKVVYKGHKELVTIICPEHGEFQKTPQKHLAGQGCQKCSKVRLVDLNYFLEKSNNIHGNLYNYDKVKFKRNLEKVEIICPVHGSFWQTPKDHSSGQGCPRCSMSRGEKRIFNFLSKNGISFFQEYRFKESVISSKRFDFFIPSVSLCIEYQGIQHYKPIGFFGGEAGLEELQKSDLLKSNYCMERKIDLIKIPYWDFDNIERILNKALLKEVE